MKKLIIGIWLSMVATVVYANCTTQTYNINGKFTTCTTCCYGNGNCNTTCFQEMDMLSHIRDVIGDKAIVSTEPFGVDEERQLIAFEVNDLAAVIQDVIRTCADCCTTPADREAVLELLTQH